MCRTEYVIIKNLIKLITITYLKGKNAHMSLLRLRLKIFFLLHNVKLCRSLRSLIRFGDSIMYISDQCRYNTAGKFVYI